MLKFNLSNINHRLGIHDAPAAKNTSEEVNDYLARAIDARSIDRLRSQHCRLLLLSFKRPKVEEKVRFPCIEEPITIAENSCREFFAKVLTSCTY